MRTGCVPSTTRPVPYLRAFGFRRDADAVGPLLPQYAESVYVSGWSTSAAICATPPPLGTATPSSTRRCGAGRAAGRLRSRRRSCRWTSTAVNSARSTCAGRVAARRCPSPTSISRAPRAGAAGAAQCAALRARTFGSAGVSARGACSSRSAARLSFHAIYCRRAEAPGFHGDWYDAFALPDGRIVVSIGDVVGLGLDAAIAMVNVRQAIRGVAQVHPDPAVMLEKRLIAPCARSIPTASSRRSSA